MNKQIWEALIDVIGKENGDIINHTNLINNLQVIFDKQNKYKIEIIPFVSGSHKFLLRLIEQ